MNGTLFMHPNPVFHDADAARNLAFARDRGFGVLAMNAPEGPLISHVPFVLSGDGASVALHLVRSNPIARLLDSQRWRQLCVARLVRGARSGADVELRRRASDRNAGIAPAGRVARAT